MAKKSPIPWRATKTAKNDTKKTGERCASHCDQAGSSATTKPWHAVKKYARNSRSAVHAHAVRTETGQKKTSEKKMRDQLGRSQLAALKWMVRRMGSSAHHIGRPRREVGRGPTRIHQSDLTRSVDLGVCQIRSDIFWTITRSVRSDRFGTIEKQG